MSIQLNDSTAQGVYGAAVVNELEALVASKSWQLKYIAETGKFSILGCGPTVHKQEIEAIFARRTNLQYTIDILDSSSSGHREFTLTRPVRIVVPSLQSAVNGTQQGVSQTISYEDRARAFLADALMTAERLSPDEPPLQLRLNRNFFSPPLQAAIGQVLAGNTRIVLTWT